MERKIGEIFEYNGEWYQCIIGHCNQCSFDEAGTCKFIGNPYCAYRNDKKLACFKKLEKVGEPYRRWLSPFNNIMVQRYRLYGRNVIMPDEPIMLLEPNYKNSVEIEIKQIKEDMGDNDDIRPYDELFSPGTVSNTKYLAKEDMEEKKLNLKPFDIQKAREGKPVCTRDGRKARIICFDRKLYHDGYNYPIVAMVNDNDNELVHAYTQDGLLVGNMEGKLDLMMLPEKKEGWVNVYREESNNNERLIEQTIYKTRKDAFEHACPQGYITTTKINWEE